MQHTNTVPDIPILFQDNHLLVVHKPAGLLSQEDHTGNPDLQTLCKEYLVDRFNKPGKAFLGLVHRLDRPVSGVMVLAKTSKAASRLSEQIRKRTVKKEYLAVVEGETSENGFYQDHLLKDEKTNTTTVVKPGTPGSKESILTFQKLGSSDGFTLLRIKLITGRAHQIRVQLSEHGNPIAGDRKYGSKQEHNIALHAFSFKLEHPTLRTEQEFRSDPEKDEPWIRFTELNR